MVPMRCRIEPKIELRQSESNARWWEAYLVRYAIGTIVGALCIYALLEDIGGTVMAKALMMPAVGKEQFDVLISACKDANTNACVAQLQLFQAYYGFSLPQLILLGIYGLAYCYVASAPGLVAHAVRRQLIFGGDEAPSQTTWFAGIKFAIFFTIAVILFPLCVFLCAGIAAARWPTLVAALLFVIWQILLIRNEYRQESELLTFYEQLHHARNNDPKISLDSYRHLREHGNAFFIVVLELMFFMVVVSTLKVFGLNPYWPVFLVVWVVPGAMVYFLGHRIEALFRRKHGTANGGDSP